MVERVGLARQVTKKPKIRIVIVEGEKRKPRSLSCPPCRMRDATADWRE